MKVLALLVIIILAIMTGVAKVLMWLFRDEYETRSTWSWWDK